MHMLSSVFYLATLLGAAAAASPIKHVVVVMEENRAFDHMFGWASELLGVDGLTGKETNPTSTKEADPKQIPVRKGSPYIGPCDPCHGLPCTTEKIYGKKQVDARSLQNVSMDGFAEYENGHQDYCGVMEMFTPDQLPVIMTLAKEYAIMDRFFCSMPGPTWPNRLYAQSGTSAGLTATLQAPWYHQHSGEFFPQKSIYDQVEEAGLEWKLYYSDTPWELFLGKLARSPGNIQTLESFFDDCKTGNLPAYSWIDPLLGVNLTTGVGSNDQHPDHDVRAGEVFLKNIYEALRASPAWNETLLVITYDEHGGFYDHVPPPTGVPPPDNESSYPDEFAFDRLGIRIPTLLVSPWIKKGTVISEPPAAQKPSANSEYELSSILGTARKLLGVKDVPLTARDAWAATFEHAIGSTLRDDCPRFLPDPPPPAPEHIASEAAQPLHELQTHTAEVLAHLNGVAPPSLETQAEVNPWVTAAFANHHARATRRAQLRNYTLQCSVCGDVKWAETGWDIVHGTQARILTRQLKVGNMSLCLEATGSVEGSEVGVGICALDQARELGLAANQRWTFAGDATIRPLQNTSLCLTSLAYLPSSAHSPKVVLELCSGSVAQHWSYGGSLAPGPEGHGEIHIFADVNCLGITMSSAATSIEAVWA